MFHRMLTGWASDVLSPAQPLTWRDADPIADYRNRDWKLLYAGSVLDD